MRIHGEVQGVFFRDSLRRLADGRGVAGSAENCDDGSVEVVLEGPREAVEDLIAWCAHGPERARVGGVEVDEEQPQGMRGGFMTG